MDLTPKQQTSEAVRQAETILIMTGQHPSVDQVAAVIGLAAILDKFGKKVIPVISDTLPQSVNLLNTDIVNRQASGPRDFVLKLDVTKSEVDKLRYEVIDGKLNVFITPYKGNFAPSDVTFDYGESRIEADLAIVLGVPTRARIDKIYEQNQASFENIPLVNLDFHRSNENYGAVNLIEPNASSLCEMLVALAESLQGGIIDDGIATALLMGIVASTDRFTAAHTTSKSLTVAAQMMAAGAKQQAVVRALYKDGKGGEGRGGERSESRSNDSRGGGERSERREPRQEPRAERQERQPEPRHDQRPEQRPEPRPLREPDEAPRQRDGQLPIISPSHIEMSEPEPAQHSGQPMPPVAPVQPVTPLDQVPVVPEQPEPQPLPTQTSVPTQPAPPMADFAAAAEILAQRVRDDSDDDHQ